MFGSTADPRASKLCASVQYFLNGTQEGFLRYQQHGSASQRLVSEPRASAGGGYAEGTQHKRTVRTGKECRSCSVPMLVVTNEEETSLSTFPSSSGLISKGPSTTSPDHSLPMISPISSPVSSLSSLSGSFAVPPTSHMMMPSSSFLTSSSKIQTRRHNSVPLLRNIPIICEEEDGDVIKIDQRVAAITTMAQRVTENVDFSSNLDCPSIRITDSEVQPVQHESSFSGRCSASVQVPQIVIEVSELPEDNPQPVVDVPSIDITAADDDTDVEEDLEDIDVIDHLNSELDVNAPIDVSRRDSQPSKSDLGLSPLAEPIIQDPAYECDDEDDDNDSHQQTRKKVSDDSSPRSHRRRKIGQVKKSITAEENEFSAATNEMAVCDADTRKIVVTGSQSTITSKEAIDSGTDTAVPDKEFTGSALSEPSTPTVPVASRGSVVSLGTIAFKGSLLSSASMVTLDSSTGNLSVPVSGARKNSDESSMCSRRTSASSAGWLCSTNQQNLILYGQTFS